MSSNRTTAYRPSPIRVSRHAATRMCQRGIQSDLVQMLLTVGSENPCGGRSLALTIGDDVAAELRSDGLCPQQVDRLRRLRAVVSNDGELVTVMHRYKRHRGFRSRAMMGARH